MSPAFARANTWWWLGWLWCAVVLVLALMPAPAVPGGHHIDKVMHAATFACLAAWFGALLERPRWLLAGVWLAVFGALIEGGQALTGRDPEWLDFVADVIGIAAGLLLLRPLTAGALLYIEARVRPLRAR